jgi:hypothetical protein
MVGRKMGSQADTPQRRRWIKYHLFWAAQRLYPADMSEWDAIEWTTAAIAAGFVLLVLAVAKAVKGGRRG